MHKTQENMIWEVEDDLDSSNLDYVGALDLSSFKPGVGEGFKLTELCEVCSDKASGGNILQSICGRFIVHICIFRAALWRDELRGMQRVF
jgi:hypothetical protein